MIRKYVIGFAAAAALATGTAAFGQMQGSPQGQMTDGQMNEEAEATSSNPDLAFASTVVSHARLQQQISNLVAQKATDPQIKQLAQEISSDYQQLSQRVQQAAQKEGLTVHPERMLPRDQAVLNHMQRLSPEALQRNYIFHEAGAIQTQQLLAEWASKNAQKPEIKQAAQEVANKLQQRNQTVQKLAQTQVGGGGGGGQ